MGAARRSIHHPPMKYRLTTFRPSNRARKFTREIAVASAITLAALIVFLVSREPTEMAAVPPATIDPVPTPQ